jgi:hypothetical protein
MSNAEEIAHQIREYRANAARMRAIANPVRSKATREQFEQLARELEHLADQEEVRIAGDRSKAARRRDPGPQAGG